MKDSAIAIYSRDVAHRVVERAAALGDFTTMTPERARELAAKYDLNYLVTEGRLDLPVVVREQPVPDLRLTVGATQRRPYDTLHSYRSASIAAMRVARRAGT